MASVVCICQYANPSLPVHPATSLHPWHPCVCSSCNSGCSKPLIVGRFVVCIRLLGLQELSTQPEWLHHKQQKVFSHSSGGQMPRIKAWTVLKTRKEGLVQACLCGLVMAILGAHVAFPCVTSLPLFIRPLVILDHPPPLWPLSDLITSVRTLRFPAGANGKEPTCQCRWCRRHSFDPWVGTLPWRRAWQPTPVFLPGESHGRRSLVGYSPRGHKSQTWLSD